MNLSQEQINAVKQELENGAKLSDIQKLLSEKFSINLSYMDVRFLIDDLNLELKEKQTNQETKEDKKETPQAPQEQRGVEVELDPVQRPGAAAGGNVTFTDGTKAKWELDMEGRLRLGGTAPDYRPSQEDVADFQNKLRELIGG